MQKTRGVFSLNLTVSLLIGSLLTAVCLLFPGRLADALGANEALRRPLMEYTTGFAVGIIPQLLAGQFASFLQMERQDKLGYIGIGTMLTVNIVLDVLFVAVFKLDVRGLALATALANWGYFLVLLSYYFTKKAQLRYSLSSIRWNELPDMVKIGLPGGNTVCLPYLAALIRLADEIDVAADRNSQILYDIRKITDAHQIYCNKLQAAVTRLHVTPDGFVMDVWTQDEAIYHGLCEVREKIQETLDLCRSVVQERTLYRITQKRVEMRSA